MSDIFTTLPNYQVCEQLYNGSRTQVYRGVSQTRQRPVTLKILRNPHPNFDELIKFRNQYAIARTLEHPTIVRPLALERYGNGYILVMPDNGAIPLRDYWQQSSQAPNVFLNIAIQLAQALHYLAQQRIIHKDLKPANILIEPETQQVKLVDFSISTSLPKERQQLVSPNVLEGTLAYISPEQTGRMNRGIDYRTDFYSLGVTFYELLLGELPFQSDDPMALIHAHIAQIPKAFADEKFLTRTGKAVPQVLLDIVCKLMAKNAENRYQSALGLQHDLEQCLQQWETTGEIHPFELGKRDVCDRFIIPEKLYGRQTQVQTLLDAFARVAEGATETILVAGFSGIGKTAVINEVHKPIVRQRGYFIRGKFDQFNRNIPFSAFIQAFRDLMEQLLGESDLKLAAWKTKILEAVGESGQVIVEVVPELERIIGPQSPIPELSGSAAQNRFNLLFGKFVRAFATQEHPLTIFLDDLQWSDSASLDLLKLLMDGSGTRYLLVLGAYRDNEVYPAHPLMLSARELKKNRAVISTIFLEPLAVGDINCLIAQTLSCGEELARPLTELVYRKTQGNPFFTTQFLKGLHEDGLITFDRNLGYWECDLVRIRDAALTNDVVTFMVGRLQKLSQATQNALKLAACIGNQFDLNTLALVCEKSVEEVAEDIWDALQEELLVPISQAYKLFQSRVEEATENTVTVSYRFLHDRIQQAAYSLIPDDGKTTTHYHIGQLLLQKIPPRARVDRIFELVSQLNYGTALVTDCGQRDELAQLNLIACRKAKAATAYRAGRDYAIAGLSWLGENGWNRQYETTLAFYNESAELASLCGDFQAMERYVQTVIAQARTLLDKIAVYRIEILAAVYQNQLTRAMTLAGQLLEQLGVVLPETPTHTDIQDSLAEIGTLTGDREIEELAHLPLMTDLEQIAIVQIANSVIPTAFNSGSTLFPLLVCLSVERSVRYGNTSTSAFVYGCYGILVCNLHQDVDTGVKFGQLALQVISQLNAKAFKAEVLHVVGLFLLHRKSHVRDTLPLARQGYAVALEVGNLEYVGYTAHFCCLNSFWCGQPLVVLEQETRAYCHRLEQLNQLTTANWCRIYWQPLLNLLGAGNDPSILTGEALEETAFLPQLTSASDFFGLYFFHLYKLMLCYLFEDVEAARHHGIEGRNYLVAGAGTVGEAAFYLYDSLGILAAASSPASETSEAFDRLEENQTKLQHWARYAPMNYQHKVDLVAAEKSRVFGAKADAIEQYDRAIAGAKANQYIQEEALANELAAKFYLDWGKEAIAASYMQEAYYCYARWGSAAKTHQLEEKYPQLLAPILKNSMGDLESETPTQKTSETISSTTTGFSTALDLATVLKASQALSEEIDLDKLLSKLMQVAIENAGAENGVLVLSSSVESESEAEELVVAAQYAGKQCNLRATRLQDSPCVPLTLIQYVWRTQKKLVFDDARTQTNFAVDPYMLEHQPKSVLCLPLQKQGRAVALLYLENNRTTQAFTPDRVEILKILASQAVISLENAQLYKKLADYSQNLEQKVTQRTQELSETLKQLQETQNELIQSEKMAALGQLVAGVAHEVNTPLGAIRSSIGNIADFMDRKLHTLPTFFQNLSSDRQRDFLALLDRSTQHSNDLSLLSSREKRKIRRQLTRQLEAAQIERANLIADTLVDIGVRDRLEEFFELLKDRNSQEILNEIDQLTSIRRSTQTISMATDRAAKVVFALKTYAHDDRSSQKVEAQIIDGIETILILYNAQLKQGIEIVRNYEENLPSILCYPDELNQVWTNLIHNAIQAMNNQGKLTIRVGQCEPHLHVSITDTGTGISPEIQDKIFQPFFTTKPAGEGSGLGLDIIHKIVKKHQGQIEFESVPGCTTFHVWLPIQEQKKN
ncbi:MAG: AAA family ATPase [Cyanobacteriota bacterium]|nr:AAA family ATPase [Cyanobacteriota bacterium]